MDKHRAELQHGVPPWLSGAETIVLRNDKEGKADLAGWIVKPTSNSSLTYSIVLMLTTIELAADLSKTVVVLKNSRVEQAFRPAVKLLKRSALAAEVLDQV